MSVLITVVDDDDSCFLSSVSKNIFVTAELPHLLPTNPNPNFVVRSKIEEQILLIILLIGLIILTPAHKLLQQKEEKNNIITK